MSTPTLPPLLEVAELAAQAERDNVLIIDVSSPENYLAGHIPGALHLPPGSLLCGTPPAAGKLPEPEQLQQLFSYLGLRPDHHVIAYDDEGGGWAGRLLWTLEVLGHQQYSYLNGGIHAWRGAGLDIETETNEPISSNFEVTINRDPIAEIEDIQPRLNDSQLRIWDARSPQEYRGERSGSARAGHIPGAINIDWLELIDGSNDTRLVDLEQLKQRLIQLDLGPDKDVVTHCQSHHRSSLTWLAMRLLNYPSVKGYHGSWGEWGNREDLPIEVDDSPIEVDDSPIEV
jgi:thiosulfate/3-mercaptopyruvate sulfurtransferase